MWTILNHNSYLFFILAIQVLLIAYWISGGIGNSLSKPTLASYYADLNLLNQPVSLKNNVQAKLLVEIWLGPTSQPTPTHLEIRRYFIEAFSNHGSNICFWLSCLSLQYLWPALPLPPATSPHHFFFRVPQIVQKLPLPRCILNSNLSTKVSLCTMVTLRRGTLEPGSALEAIALLC